MKAKYEKPAITVYEMETESFIAGSTPGMGDKNPGDIKALPPNAAKVWWFGDGDSDFYNDSRVSKPVYDDEEF